LRYRSRRRTFLTVHARVLVVDDHEDTVVLFAEELRSADFRVEITTSPNEAVNLALRWQPDVVVLDIAMPEMDGYELARLIRSYASTLHTRLVAVSAHAFDFSEQQVPPGGWDACVRKPVEPGTLAGVVRTVLAAPEGSARKTGPVMIRTPRPGATRAGNDNDG
jgi:CheY-like chemotaxis protein